MEDPTGLLGPSSASFDDEPSPRITPTSALRRKKEQHAKRDKVLVQLQEKVADLEGKLEVAGQVKRLLSAANVPPPCVNSCVCTIGGTGFAAAMRGAGAPVAIKPR